MLMDRAHVAPAAHRLVPPTKAGKDFFYRPELDVLRFFAFLLVFAHHSFPAPVGGGVLSHILRAVADGSALGVPLFFLLSAYLITELLFREQRSTGTIDMRAFYLRRVLRIWPLYFAVLGAATLFGFVYASQRVPLAGLLAYLLLAGNWWTGLHGFLPAIAGPLWSISVEEQFYVLWPSYVRAFGRRAVFLLAVVVWAGAQCSMFWLVRYHAATADQLWTNSFVQFQYFAIGVMLAVVLNGKAGSYSLGSRMALCTFGMLCLLLPNLKFDILGVSGSTPLGAALTVYAVAGLGVAAIFCGFYGAKLPKNCLPLTYLGKISYGLYMFHLALIMATLRVLALVGVHRGRLMYVWFVTLPLTVLCAHLSFKFFERPFLRMKQRLTVIKTQEV